MQTTNRATKSIKWNKSNHRRRDRAEPCTLYMTTIPLQNVCISNNPKLSWRLQTIYESGHLTRLHMAVINMFSFFLSIYCLLNMWHPRVQQEINTEDAKPITFLSFIHALHAWKRQMALWAAFYRSRFVKDKEDKDMKDKPDRKDSAGEPVDEVEQIQREILTRCAGKEIQETSKIRKQMKNYFRKKKPRTWPKKSNKQWKVWSKSRCCWRSHQGKSKRLERRALMMQPQKPRPDICAANWFPKYCVQLCEQST